ncbi:hypothetical protein OAU50_02150 [Planctomycetota bacterium]|nr:hypothetical protein [Planctomycetota bacterium]
MPRKPYPNLRSETLLDPFGDPALLQEVIYKCMDLTDEAEAMIERAIDAQSTTAEFAEVGFQVLETTRTCREYLNGLHESTETQMGLTAQEFIAQPSQAGTILDLHERNAKSDEIADIFMMGHAETYERAYDRQLQPPPAADGLSGYLSELGYTFTLFNENVIKDEVVGGIDDAIDFTSEATERALESAGKGIKKGIDQTMPYGPFIAAAGIGLGLYLITR